MTELDDPVPHLRKPRKLAESDMPEWERDMVRDAERVEAGFGNRNRWKLTPTWPG